MESLCGDKSQMNFVKIIATNSVQYIILAI